jgi:hypothetical protein
MQYAKCTDDEKVWEAAKFADLTIELLEIKRRSLICTQCSEFAWFRKESSHGHPAHFCAHHKDDCDLKVEYFIVDNPRNDATLAEGEVESGDTIIVRLDQELGGQVSVNEVQPSPTPGQGEGGRTFILRGAGRESAQHFTLRRILFRLVQSPDFRNSDSQVSFKKNEEEVLIRGPVREVIASFADITRAQHHGQLMFFWGPIASAGKTSDGKLWLNSSTRNQSAKVMIFQDIVDEFLAVFSIDDLEELAGAYVLVAGTCYFADTGKPVIRCGSPKYIVVRRYRDEKLRAEP